MSGLIQIEEHQLPLKNTSFHLAKVIGGYTEWKLVTSPSDPADIMSTPVEKPIDDFMGYGDLVTSGPAHTVAEGYIGPQILDGVVYKDFNAPTSNYGLKGRGTECLGVRADGSAKIYSSYDGDSAAKMKADGVMWTYGFAGAMVRDGVAQDLDNSGRFDPFIFPSARQVIGVDADNQPMILTISGRSTYRGLYMNETAQLCKELGFVQAANMDGGGTAQSAYQGQVYHPSTDAGKRRWLCSAVVISVDESKAGVA